MLYEILLLEILNLRFWTTTIFNFSGNWHLKNKWHFFIKYTRIFISRLIVTVHTLLSSCSKLGAKIEGGHFISKGGKPPSLYVKIPRNFFVTFHTHNSHFFPDLYILFRLHSNKDIYQTESGTNLTRNVHLAVSDLSWAPSLSVEIRRWQVKSTNYFDKRGLCQRK